MAFDCFKRYLDSDHPCPCDKVSPSRLRYLVSLSLPFISLTSSNLHPSLVPCPLSRFRFINTLLFPDDREYCSQVTYIDVTIYGSRNKTRVSGFYLRSLPVPLPSLFLFLHLPLPLPLPLPTSPPSLTLLSGDLRVILYFVSTGFWIAENTVVANKVFFINYYCYFCSFYLSFSSLFSFFFLLSSVFVFIYLFFLFSKVI